MSDVMAMWFTPVIQRWRLEREGDEIARLASDIDLPTKNVREWVARDSIPADWFAPVARAAQVRGFDDITVERLAEIAEAKRLAKRSAPQGAAAA